MHEGKARGQGTPLGRENRNAVKARIALLPRGFVPRWNSDPRRGIQIKADRFRQRGRFVTAWCVADAVRMTQQQCGCPLQVILRILLLLMSPT